MRCQYGVLIYMKKSLRSIAGKGSTTPHKLLICLHCVPAVVPSRSKIRIDWLFISPSNPRLTQITCGRDRAYQSIGCLYKVHCCKIHSTQIRLIRHSIIVLGDSTNTLIESDLWSSTKRWTPRHLIFSHNPIVKTAYLSCRNLGFLWTIYGPKLKILAQTIIVVF